MTDPTAGGLRPGVTDDLLARFAHHAFTPLHLVGGALELAEQATDLADARAHLRVARTGVRQALRLSRNLLNLVEGGPRPMTPQPVDLGPALRAIAARWRPQATTTGSLLVVESPTDRDVRLSTDLDAVTHLLDELLDNALAYGRGLVTIEASVVGSAVVIAVTDDGPGIEPALGEDAFEPLTIGEAGRRRTPPGLGLGLAAASQLARALGGVATLQASERRAGLHVAVTLPV